MRRGWPHPNWRRAPEPAAPEAEPGAAGMDAVVENDDEDAMNSDAEIEKLTEDQQSRRLAADDPGPKQANHEDLLKDASDDAPFSADPEEGSRMDDLMRVARLAVRFLKAVGGP